MPFSVIFYKWILGEEESLHLEDLVHVDRSLYEQLKKFQSVVYRAKNDADPTLDGCPIEDLTLTFTLPGFPHIELKRGGKDCAVTVANLQQYINVRAWQVCLHVSF
jgi:E3 ubiquitin-protein ligase TRIP12